MPFLLAIAAGRGHGQGDAEQGKPGAEPLGRPAAQGAPGWTAATRSRSTTAPASTSLSTGGGVLMLGCWGSEQTESDGTHAGDDTVPDAKARIMRAFSWAAFGKGCITMRQDRAESDVVQDTLFGFFSEKGGLKCYGGRRENCTKAYKWLGSENYRGGAYDKLMLDLTTGWSRLAVVIRQN